LLVDSITIDGQGEEDFRRSIEAMLRRGQADAAAEKLRALIEPYAGSILPARFRTVTSAELRLERWADLAHRIGEHDRPGHRISAVEITAGAGDPQSGRPGPVIATRYFSDEAYPFSEASRRDLLQGYGAGASAWQGHPEGDDTALSLEGMDDLFDAVSQLEARLMRSPAPGEDDIRAGSLGACYLAVLVHQAVENAIERGGLPRPLCVLAGTGDAYPYFDAPVVSAPECREAGLGASVPIALPSSLAEAADVEDEEEEPELEEDAAQDDERAGRTQSYGSLLSLGATIRAKKPVITVDATEAAAASHHYELGAQHRLTVAGNSDRVGVLPELVHEGVAAMAPADDGWIEPEDPKTFADASHTALHEPDDALRPPPPTFADEAAHVEPPVTILAPYAPNEITAPETAPDQDDFAVLPDAQSRDGDDAAEIAPPPPPNVIPAPAAHSLRSRVVLQQSPSVTPMDRVMAFLRSAANWFGRFRR
jgi:hypothetical protein